MKKLFLFFVAGILVITACNNSNKPAPNKDSIPTTTPIDTVKIDTVKPTDSIIKG